VCEAFTKPNIGWPTYLGGTVGSRDAAVERTGRYSQRVHSRYVGYLMYSLVKSPCIETVVILHNVASGGVKTFDLEHISRVCFIEASEDCSF
jgi:hypothetical protein